MPLLSQNRKRTSKLHDYVHVLCTALTVFSFLAGSAGRSPAQLPKSAAPPISTAEPAAPTDLLGRQTPRSAMMGFLKYEQREDYETAALYLQPTPGQDTNLANRAQQ